MVSEWTEVSFGDIFDISSSKRVLQREWQKEGIPFYRAREIVKLAKDGVVDNDLFITEDLYEDYARKYGAPEPGDLMVSAVGTLGACYQVKTNDKFYFKDASVLRFHPKKPICSRYIEHAFNSRELIDQIQSGSGSTVGTLTISRAKEMSLLLPPLEEQKRIAAILDQADALRRLRQRAIDRLNILGLAIFHEMFGDPKANPKGFPWVELGNVADFYSGNTLPEGEPFTDQIDGHLILKVSDLNHPRNQQDVVCAASWSASPGSRAGTCPPDALVFPKRGGAIGTNKKRWLKRSAILDPNLMGVRPDGKELTMSFLNGWFQTFNLSDIASGSSVPQLNKKDLAPLKVALPPIAEQVEYSRRIDTLSMVRDGALGAALHEEELFKVLQYRAFRGEL